MENITYEEFIQNILETRGRFGCGDEYHESHHIVPRCMGGEDNKENLIDLFAMYGKHHSEDARKKMRDNHQNVSGENNPRALILVQLDKEDNVINVWRYAKLAAKDLKICYTNILNCVIGNKYKSVGGYHWKYLYDNKLRSGKIVPGAISLGLITEEDALKQLEQNKND